MSLNQFQPFKTSCFKLSLSYSKLSQSSKSFSTFSPTFSSSSSSSSSSLPPIYYSHIPYKVPYQLGLALQEHLVNRRIAAQQNLRTNQSDHRAQRISSTDILILQEHSPVFTDGRRASHSTSEESESADAERLKEEGRRLKKAGADYCLTKRGGLVTYHGPGQITGYPILDLGEMGLSTRTYIQGLEASIRDFLSTHHSLSTLPCNPNMTGVFFTPTQKVSSIGVQVRHRISSHGFALNITDEPLDWFNKIVACGLDGVRAESLKGRLNQLRLEKGESKEVDVSVDGVMKDLVQCLGKGLGRDMRKAGEELLRFESDGKGEVLEKVWVDGEEVRS